MPARPGDAGDVAELGDIAAAAGLRRIAILAWRDLDDPEAGGSELHASRVAALWGQAGIEVTMRTSYAPGSAAGQLARRLPRHPQGRPLPRVPARRVQRDDGLARRERRARRDLERHAVLLAGVGREPAARGVAAPRARLDVGDDAAAAPRAARPHASSSGSRRRSTARSPIVTLSESSKDEIVAPAAACGRRTSRSCRPGIDPSFTPGRHRATRSPLVVAVGRLVPVKRFDVLIDALAAVKARRPDLRAVIVGEGYERDALERQIAELGAHGLDLAARPRRRRRRCSISTAGRGCSRARRATRAGA